MQTEYIILYNICWIFLGDKTPVADCTVHLSETDVKDFTYAIMNEYWYQMYIDGLPVWGKVGERDESDGKFYIYSHKKFDIGRNGDQIVDVNLSTEKKELIIPGANIKFSYEVNWKASVVEFKDRFDKYLDPKFFQHRVSNYFILIFI